MLKQLSYTNHTYHKSEMYNIHYIHYLDPPHLIHISEGLTRLCTTQSSTARKISFFCKKTALLLYTSNIIVVFFMILVQDWQQRIKKFLPETIGLIDPQSIARSIF